MPNYNIIKLSRRSNASYLRVCVVISGMKDLEWVRDPATFVREFAERIRQLDSNRALSVKQGYRAKVTKQNEVEIAHYRLDGTYLYPTHKVVFNEPELSLSRHKALY